MTDIHQENPYYDQYQFGETKYWKLFVHERGVPYLGRAYAWYKGDARDLFADCPPEALTDLQHAMQLMHAAATQLWQPDVFNYAAFTNEAPHLHVHIIPRYREPRTWQGVRCVDERWGGNYAPTEKTPMPTEWLHTVRDAYRDALHNMQKQ